MMIDGEIIRLTWKMKECGRIADPENCLAIIHRKTVMAGKITIRKEGYTYKGQLRHTAKWYVNLTDHAGQFHAIPGFRDKEATVQLGLIIQKLDITAEAKSPPDALLMKSVKALPEKTRQRLAQKGFIPKTSVTALKPLPEYIGKWVKYMKDTQVCEAHYKQNEARVKRILSECDIKHLPDLERSKIQGWAASFLESGSAGATMANYIRAIRAFANWLVAEGIIETSPLKHMKVTTRIPTVEKRPRRALWPEQCRELLKAAVASLETVNGMTGPDRALLYRVALETGLRWSELRSLRVESFDLDSDIPTVTVEASASKNRKESVLPLRRALVEILRKKFKGRKASDKAFIGMKAVRGAKMLRHDLENAGIPYETPEGTADFHALRHSYISTLTRSGVHPKMAQTLARHSTVELTLGRYSHVKLKEQADALENALIPLKE